MFTEDDVRKNRDFFADKLRAEKQKADAVKKVKEGKGDFLLLDTRPREAFEQAHIPGAWSVPLAEIPSLASKLPRERELVTYCWNHS
jgi:rhodanese-related sulfurtransferase